MGDVITKGSGLLRKLQNPITQATIKAVNKKFGDPIESLTTSSAKDKIDSLEAQKQGSIDRTNVIRRSLLRQ